MEFLNAIDTKEAQNILKKLSKEMSFSTKMVSIDNALNMIIATDIISLMDYPKYNKSAVDGYAVFSENIDTVPKTLKISHEVLMGKGLDEICDKNDCVYVPTGGFVPSPYDAMVMIEDTSKDENGYVTIFKKVPKDNLLVFKGDDFKKGDIAIHKNTKITPTTISVLAFLGIEEVLVYEKPKVTIISSGDELVSLHDRGDLYKVIDINSYALKGLIENLNLEVLDISVVKDDYDEIYNKIKDAMKSSNFVFISGGSSVGVKDFTYKVLNDLATVYIHGIHMKPGKPTIVAKKDNCILFGLPGHPMSAIVVFNVLAKPFILECIKDTSSIKRPVTAIVTKDVKPAFSKETYQMISFIEENGTLYAEPIFTKSGFVSTMQKAEGYFIIEKDTDGVKKGDTVLVYEVDYD